MYEGRECMDVVCVDVVARIYIYIHIYIYLCSRLACQQHPQWYGSQVVILLVVVLLSLLLLRSTSTLILLNLYFYF